MNTQKHSRRAFLNLTSAGLAATTLPSWLRAATSDSPDLIILNATVWTLDSALPKAEAFAIHNGKFVALGTTEEIRSLAGKQTRTLDARRQTVVPGFIDCHNHAGGKNLL